MGTISLACVGTMAAKSCQLLCLAPTERRRAPFFWFCWIHESSKPQDLFCIFVEVVVHDKKWRKDFRLIKALALFPLQIDSFQPYLGTNPRLCSTTPAASRTQQFYHRLRSELGHCP